MSLDNLIFALQILGITFGVICITLSIIIYSHYYINAKTWTAIEIYGEFSIILFGISSVCSSFYFMSKECQNLLKDSTDSSGSTYCTIIVGLWTFSWRFGCVCLYLLFSKRLQITFDQNKYNTNSNFIYYLIYILCALFILFSIAQFLEYILYFDYHETNDGYTTVEIIGTIFTEIIDLLLSIGLIGAYIRKLWQLNEQVANPFSINKDGKEINSAQNKILNAIGKITILSCFAIISSQLLLIVQTSIYFQTISTSQLIYIIWFMLNNVDCMINTFCIFLSFDFNVDLYHKICGYFQKCCFKFCKMVYTKTNNKNNTLEMNLLDDQDNDNGFNVNGNSNINKIQRKSHDDHLNVNISDYVSNQSQSESNINNNYVYDNDSRY